MSVKSWIRRNVHLGVSLEERFWEKVKVDKPDRCWEWQASKRHFGYGQFWADGLMQPAHRISWNIHFGEIPKGICVLHKCDNPPCVNPDHLYLGTRTDNSKDRTDRERGVKGEQCGTSKLTERDVLEIRNLSSKYSCRKLAKRFGVSHTTIEDVVNRKYWIHI